MNITKKEGYEELVLANFWARLAAWLVDVFLLILIVLITRPFPLSVEIGFNTETLFWGGGAWFGISAFYFIIFWASLGQTVGSILMNIKIIRKNNSKFTLIMCIWRYIAYVAALLPLGFGLWSMVFDKYKQTWADHAVNTVVVKAPKMKKEQRSMPKAA